MNSRLRKFIGTLVLLVSLGIYLPVTAIVASGRLAEVHVLLQMLFFLVAGLIWVLPAAFLVRWMQRPDEDEGQPGKPTPRGRGGSRSRAQRERP